MFKPLQKIIVLIVSELYKLSVVLSRQFSGEMQRIDFALCYRRVCVSVCVCVRRICGPQENGLRYRRHICSKLFEMTTDPTHKSFAQIGLQIPRWQTKWRP